MKPPPTALGAVLALALRPLGCDSEPTPSPVRRGARVEANDDYRSPDINGTAAAAGFRVLLNDETFDPSGDMDDPTRPLAITSVANVGEINNREGVCAPFPNREDQILYSFPPSRSFSGIKTCVYTACTTSGLPRICGSARLSILPLGGRLEAENVRVTVRSDGGPVFVDVLGDSATAFDMTGAEIGRPLVVARRTSIPGAGRGSCAISADGRGLVYTPPPGGAFEGNVACGYEVCTDDEFEVLCDDARARIRVSPTAPTPSPTQGPTRGGELTVQKKRPPFSFL